MKRFRRRRRRLAALALLPLAALTISTTLSLGAVGASSGKARIDVSARTVPFGGTVTLRGAFPGAANAPIEIQHRASGSRRWAPVRQDRTGASGRYRARLKPRRSGYWRAELGSAPQTHAAPENAAAPEPAASAIDTGTGSERITVRSQTRATVAGRHATAGDTVAIRGTVSPSGVKRRLAVRVGGSTIATRTGIDGGFSVRWRARSPGTYPVRIDARGNRLAAGSRARAGLVTVYRPAVASWYGPGLYGNRLACGGTLTSATLGVAHRTMPCGTKLRLRYKGRSVAVEVVDRGPFAAGREFDLTSATKQRLGFPDTGTVLSSK